MFQTPNEEQCRRLSESAKGCPEAAQINQLIRSLGVSIEHEEAGQLADLSSTIQPYAIDAGSRKVLARDEEDAPTKKRVAGLCIAGQRIKPRR